MHVPAAAVTHTAPVQAPEAQSRLLPHACPRTHVGEHDSAWQSALVQVPETQSPLAPQGLAVGQVGEHIGAAQWPATQDPDAQSVERTHTCVFGAGRQRPFVHTPE